MRRILPYKRRSRRSTKNTQTRSVRRKMRGGGVPSFHIMIVTAGRDSLIKMINSLKGQLSENDAVTVVFDGKFAKRNSKYEPSWTNDMKCKVNIIEQIPGLKHYGHPTINKYLPQLDPKKTYVMFADDDDVYVDGAFDILRAKCVDPDILYLAQFKNKEGTIVPPVGSSSIEINHIGKVCGIIPFDKRSEASMGATTRTGDFDYYNVLQHKVKGVQFLDHIIYLCDNTTPNPLNSNKNLF